jgi:DNA repair exonuclease SbcCD nuclease subunit
MQLPECKGRGLFFIADPHVAATPPGQRLEGYQEQVLAKIEICLARAAQLDLVPFFLGDLFNWPRDNPNNLLVELMALFSPYKPFALVGNHDKYQARFTSDVSLAVLEAAGVVRVISAPGPVMVLNTPQGRVLVGGSPEASPLPSNFPRQDGDYIAVVWTAHHNVAFPDFKEKQIRLKEIPGVDYLVNGHIHRPQPSLRVGATLWCNPGNVTRLTFTRRSKERKPAAAIWTPNCEDLERWIVPHLPFEQVFPDQELPPEQTEELNVSRFLEGLERLAWKRTREGAGLRQFLQANLNPESPETGIVWELYEEVIRG